MRYILLIIYCFVSLQVYSDEVDDLGKIVIGIDVPPTASSETQSLKGYLTNKVALWLTQSGYSSNGASSFYLIPDVVMENVAVAEGGMKDVYVVSGSLYLKIIQEGNDVIFSSISIPFRDSHTKKENALKTELEKFNIANSPHY